MTVLQALILGIVQGITEFLPISSSGHLVIGESLLNLDVQNLKSFDIFVHLGSLFAILIYFWPAIKKMLVAVVDTLKNPKTLIAPRSSDQKTLYYLVIASIPAIIAGITLEDTIDSLFRDPKRVAAAMIIMALYFIYAEYFSKKQKHSNAVGFKAALFMGLAQSVALIPGISRSGSTIATGVMNQTERTTAAEFSFLMGSIIIAGAAGLTTIKNAELLMNPEYLSIHAIGLISSFLASILSIQFLMKFLKKHSLTVFAIYLIIVGVLLLKV